MVRDLESSRPRRSEARDSAEAVERPLDSCILYYDIAYGRRFTRRLNRSLKVEGSPLAATRIRPLQQAEEGSTH